MDVAYSNLMRCTALLDSLFSFGISHASLSFSIILIIVFIPHINPTYACKPTSLSIVRIHISQTHWDVICVVEFMATNPLVLFAMWSAHQHKARDHAKWPIDAKHSALQSHFMTQSECNLYTRKCLEFARATCHAHSMQCPLILLRYREVRLHTLCNCITQQPT